MSNTCPQCQSTDLHAARLSGASLEPAKGGALLQGMSKIDVQANVCAGCGHITLSADPEHLKVIKALG